MSNQVDLDSLVGGHMLDAVDMFTESVKKTYGDYYEDCELIRFRLNGTIYTAMEDPSDGYRSCMESLIVSPDAEMKNVFQPVQVVGRKKPNGYGTNDTLELIDVVTGKVVLEVGTDNSDDYYPSFVAAFFPANMVTNAAVSPSPQGTSEGGQP